MFMVVGDQAGALMISRNPWVVMACSGARVVESPCGEGSWLV